MAKVGVKVLILRFVSRLLYTEQGSQLSLTDRTSGGAPGACDLERP